MAPATPPEHPRGGEQTSGRTKCLVARHGVSETCREGYGGIGTPGTKVWESVVLTDDQLWRGRSALSLNVCPLEQSSRACCKTVRRVKPFKQSRSLSRARASQQPALHNEARRKHNPQIPAGTGLGSKPWDLSRTYILTEDLTPTQHQTQSAQSSCAINSEGPLRHRPSEGPSLPAPTASCAMSMSTVVPQLTMKNFIICAAEQHQYARSVCARSISLRLAVHEAPENSQGVTGAQSGRCFSKANLRDDNSCSRRTWPAVAIARCNHTQAVRIDRV